MRWIVTVIGMVLMWSGTLGAQESDPAVGGFLFSYEARTGSRADFEEGYRAHLEWHRSKGDSLSWFGWDVLAGPGLGRFVDGTFGIRFSSLDHRVDPAGDARDAAANMLPHADPVMRALVRLRTGLSTATPLEEDRAFPLVQVERYSGPPAGLAMVEEALDSLREDSDGEVAALLPYTVYEQVVGGRSAEFFLMIWRDGFGSYDAAEENPERLVRRYLREAGAEIGVRSELWLYRPDLTLIPESGGGR